MCLQGREGQKEELHLHNRLPDIHMSLNVELLKGATRRTLFDRAFEHWDDLKKRSEDSVLS